MRWPHNRRDCCVQLRGSASLWTHPAHTIGRNGGRDKPKNGAANAGGGRLQERVSQWFNQRYSWSGKWWSTSVVLAGLTRIFQVKNEDFARAWPLDGPACRGLAIRAPFGLSSSPSTLAIFSAERRVSVRSPLVKRLSCPGSTPERTLSSFWAMPESAMACRS